MYRRQNEERLCESKNRIGLKMEAVVKRYVTYLGKVANKRSSFRAKAMNGKQQVEQKLATSSGEYSVEVAFAKQCTNR